jgi:hypothetical protein
MKTLFQIDKLISDLTEKYRDVPAGSEKSKSYKKDEKQCSFLRMCKRFLETNPSEDVLLRQKKEVDDKIKTLDCPQKFSHWWACDSDRIKLEEPAAKSKYRKEYGIDKLKKQSKTLQFILS